MDIAPSIGEQWNVPADSATLRAGLCYCMVQHTLLAAVLLISWAHYCLAVCFTHAAPLLCPSLLVHAGLIMAGLLLCRTACSLLA
jgi:hypothetical protein